MSTSATDSIYEHDRRIVRTPRTALVVAHRGSSSRGWLRWAQRAAPLRERAALERGQSRGHGSGARGPGALNSHIASGASHRDHSRGDLRPNPIASDTSCRTFVTGQAGDSRLVVASFPKPAFTNLPDARRLNAARASQGRPTRLSAKSCAFRYARGAFHRRICPVRG